MTTFRGELLKPFEPDTLNVITTGLVGAWFLDDQLTSSIQTGLGGTWSFSRTHPIGHLGTRNGSVYIYADDSGANDDALVLDTVYPTLNNSGHRQQTVAITFTPELYSTTSQEILAGANTLGFQIYIFPTGVVRLGYEGGNGYRYHYQTSGAPIVYGEANTIVLSIDGNSNAIVFSINGSVTVAESFVSDPSRKLSFIGGGDMPSVQAPSLLSSASQSSYHFKGEIHGLSLFHRALNQEECHNLALDPYQLFRTAEDETKDHNLVIDNATQQVDIPEWSASGDFRIELDFKEVTNRGFIFSSSNGTGKLELYRAQDDALAVFLNEVAVLDGATPTTVSDGNYHNVVIERISDVMTLTVDGNTEDGDTVSGTVQFDLIGNREEFGAKYTYAISSLKIEEAIDSRFYDFNRTQGKQVPELLNGKHGTLIGFPEEAGYVRELNSHDGVEFDGVDDYASAVKWTNPTGAYNIEVGFSHLVNEGHNAQIIDIGRYTDGFYVIVSPISYNVAIYINGNGYSFNNSHPEIFSTLDNKIRFECTATTVTLYVNGEISETISVSDFPDFTVNSINWMVPGHALTVNVTRGILKYTKLEDVDNPENNREYRFDQTENFTVPEIVSGQNATLINFDNSYYRPEGSGELIGYQFNGVDTHANFTTKNMSGDFSITFDVTLGRENGYACILGAGNNNNFIRFDTVAGQATQILARLGSSTVRTLTLDKDYRNSRIIVTVALQGDIFSATIGSNEIDFLTGVSSNLIVNNFGRYNVSNYGGVSWTLHSVYDATNNWDGTTGDSDQIIDTVSEHRASIQNIPTSGWMPVIDKQVFTDADYPTLTLFSAESGNSGLKEYQGATSGGAALSGFADGLVIEGGTYTSPITLTTTGNVFLNNLTADDVDATGSTGDVFITSCEVKNVTG